MAAPTQDAVIQPVAEPEVHAAEPRAATSASPSRVVDRGRANAEVAAGARAAGAGLLSEAKKAYLRAVDADPNSSAGWIGLSAVAKDEGNHSAAARYAKRAVSIAPRNARFRIRLGDAYFRLYRLSEAKAQYEKAGELGHASAAGRLERVDKVGEP